MKSEMNISWYSVDFVKRRHGRRKGSGDPMDKRDVQLIVSLVRKLATAAEDWCRIWEEYYSGEE